MSYKLFEWFQEGGRIPRKTKKIILRKKLSRKEIRRMLKTIQFGPPIVTMWERRETTHGLFCPKCGEQSYRGTGNMTTYPEHWEYFYCLRCRYQVGTIDNSAFYHVLEEMERPKAMHKKGRLNRLFCKLTNPPQPKE